MGSDIMPISMMVSGRRKTPTTAEVGGLQRWRWTAWGVRISVIKAAATMSWGVFMN